MSVGDLPSVRDSSRPNHNKGRRTRASIALEPKSHCDSKTPITGVAQSRVSVSLGKPIVCRCRKRPKKDSRVGQWPGIDRVPVEIAKVEMPEGDMEEKSL